MKKTNIVLAWEPLSLLLDDGLAELVRQHHAEVGVHKEEMPLDCDWDKYFELERLGILKTLAARHNDVLIGYNSFMVMPHLHYRTTMHGLGDAIYVTLKYRHTGAGVALIDQAETDLANLVKPGYCRIVYHDKAFLEFLGPVLKKRGYVHQENIWDKLVRTV